MHNHPKTCGIGCKYVMSAFVCCTIWLTLAGRLEASASDGSRGSPTRPGTHAVRRPASFAVRFWGVQLAAPFTHHAVSQMRWNALTDESRARAFARFMSDSSGKCSQPQRTVTSSDHQLTVCGSPRIARKKGQRRRPAAERTDRKK